MIGGVRVSYLSVGNILVVTDPYFLFPLGSPFEKFCWEATTCTITWLFVASTVIRDNRIEYAFLIASIAGSLICATILASGLVQPKDSSLGEAFRRYFDSDIIGIEISTHSSLPHGSGLFITSLAIIFMHSWQFMAHHFEGVFREYLREVGECKTEQIISV